MIYLHNNFKGIREKLVYALLEDNFFHPSNTIRFFEALDKYVLEYNLMSSDSRDIDIIFCNLFNDSKHSEIANVDINTIQPQFDTFIEPNGRYKIIVSERFSYFDPQIFSDDIPSEIMFDNKALDLNIQSEQLQAYLKQVSWGKNTFQMELNALYNDLAPLNPNLIVIPLLYFHTYSRAGLLNDKRFLFVPCDLLVDDCYFNPNINKLNDVFIAGIQNPSVYPYRYLFNDKLKESSGISILQAWDKYLAHLNSKQTLINDFKSMSESTFDVVKYRELNVACLKLDLEYQNEYYSQISSCTFAIGCASVFGYPLKKYVEFMANGAVVVGQLPKFASDYGIEPNVHMIVCEPNEIIDTINNLKKKTKKDFVRKIASNARALVESKYMPRASASNFIKLLLQDVK